MFNNDKQQKIIITNTKTHQIKTQKQGKFKSL